MTLYLEKDLKFVYGSGCQLGFRVCVSCEVVEGGASEIRQKVMTR